MSAQIIVTYGAGVSLLVGAFFVFVGAVGLMKFNDPMTRMHAPTKVGTMGVGMLLVASIFHSASQGDQSIHELLIMSFLFVTAPVSAIFIAKVAIHRRTCETPPPPAVDQDWSTLAVIRENAGDTDRS